MGYIPNPAIISLCIFVVWTIVSVNTAAPPTTPAVSSGGSATQSTAPTTGFCAGIYPVQSITTPNLLNLPGSATTSTSVSLNGDDLWLRTLVPFQTYEFDYTCGGAQANTIAQVFYEIDSTFTFLQEYSCSSSSSYGGQSGRFFVKPNNAAIRTIRVRFFNPDCTTTNQATLAVTVSLGQSCRSTSSQLSTFEPFAVYTPGATNANPINPDTAYLNNFFGCPFGYDLQSTQSIYWQIDGSANGFSGVSIRFIDFNLRNSDEYLEIYQGATGAGAPTSTQLAYQFTGNFPPGAEEVYIEDPIITVRLRSTSGAAGDPNTFTGFTAVFNWNSPCKRYGSSANNYVSYLPFDNIGCVGSVPSGLTTNFYYFPISNIYGNPNRLINFAFTEFDLPAASTVTVNAVSVPSASSIAIGAQIALYTSTIADFSIPNTNTAVSAGLFALFSISTAASPRTGYGVALDIGYTFPDAGATVCSTIAATVNPELRLFAFDFDTPAVGGNIDCSGTLYRPRSTVFYLLRPSGSFTNSLIRFSLTYNLPEQIVTIYDGPSVQSPVLRTISGSNAGNNVNINDVSSGSELLFVFSSRCVTCTTANVFQLSYTFDTDLCKTSGNSLNQFPLATIGCPEGVGSGIKSYWLISGDPTSSTRNVIQRGIVTVSFTFFDIGTTNFVTIYDAETILDINTTPLNLVGRYNGNTLPPAYESTLPEVLLELDTSEASFGFIAVYTIYNGQNPCTSSSAITLSTPTGSIFCENAMDTSPQVQTVSRWFINPNNGVVALGVSYFYYNDVNNDAVDASLAFFAGSEDTDPQLGIISASPTNTGNSYNDPYGVNIPTTFNYRADRILVRFSSASNPTFFAMNYATQGIQCTTSTATPIVPFTTSEGTFGCAGLSANARRQYIISPTLASSAETIHLDFLYFRLQKGEAFFNIYEGTSSAGKLLYSFTGHTIPPQIVVRARSVFIDIDNSRTTSVSGGFEVHYYVESVCVKSRGIKVTAPQNNIACLPAREGVVSSILIDPNLGPITFSWNVLNFQGGWQLFDGSTNSATLIASGFGTNLNSAIPTAGPYVSSGRTLLLQFSTAEQEGIVTTLPEPSFGFSFTYTAAKRSQFDENLESEALSLFGAAGSDGSASWGPGVTTLYYIAPSTYARITLTITNLGLQAGDVIAIYDGPSQEYPLLMPIILGATSVVPPPVLSSGDSILIIVSTAKTSVSSDFRFSWTTAANPNPCISSQTVNLNQKFGFFGCPNGIDNSINSNWIIAPNNGPVVLEFLFFALETNADFLTLYDGASSSGPVLGTFTGSNFTTIPQSFKSNLDSFYVNVLTSVEILSEGFFAKWSTTDPCYITNTNTVLTEVFDTFGCDRGLASGIRSTWLIAPNNGVIQLSFQSLNLNSILVDGYFPNNITIYDGSDSSAPILAVVTGQILPPSVLSSGNTLFVVLQTNAATTRSMGFIADYRAIGITDPCSSNQAIVLTAPVGTVTCNPFRQNVVSSWFISPFDGPITISDNSLFSSNLNPGSPGDTLTFYDGYTQTDPVLLVVNNANSNSFAPVTSSTQSVLVVLSALSGNIIGNGAFSFNYATQSTPCERSTDVTYTALSGAISCRSIANNIDSAYIINPNGAGPNGPITIEFAAFNFEDGDYLLIIEGAARNGPNYVTYTGSVIPPNYISTSDAVTIRVITNSATRSAGFSLTYITSADPCSTSSAITYTDITRTFGCTGIAAGVSSSWLITPGFGRTIDLALLSLSPALPAGTTVTVYGGSSASGNPILVLNSLSGVFPTTRFNQDTGFTSLFVTLVSTSAGGGFTFLYAAGDNNICLDSGNTILTEEQGTFGCSNLIDNNIASTWLIAPTSAQPISLVISLAPSWDDSVGLNVFDQIRVYNGPTTASTLLTPTLSQGSATGSYTSSGANNLLVLLTTDGDTRSGGFSASYTTSSTDFCIRNIPSIPVQPVPGQISCNTLGNSIDNLIPIQSASGTRIIFTPTTIITELNQDFVIIYDGTDTTATEIARYSGFTQDGPIVTTSSNNAVVRLLTSAQTPSQRVLLNYVQTSDPCIATDQTTTYPASAGRFGCSQIRAPSRNTFIISPTGILSTQRVYLQFDDLYIPPGAGSITIYDNNAASGTILATATGFNLPAPITSTGGALTLLLDVQATSSFFVSYTVVNNPITGPVVSISPSPSAPTVLTSVAPPNSGSDPSPTLLPSSTPSAPARGSSRSPIADPSFAAIPSFQPFVEPSATPSTSFSATKSSTPSISLSYTETRTATATPAATPTATRSSEFFNIRTRFNCNQTVEKCCSDFSSLWSGLSVINSQLLVVPKLCQAITARDTLVEVVFEQFGSNFHTVESILNDYWSQAGCGNQDPIDDGVCVPSTSALASGDWDDVYLLEVVEEDQYTTNLNTSAAVETTYNPIDTTYQPVFTSVASAFYPLSLIFVVLAFF